MDSGVRFMPPGQSFAVSMFRHLRGLLRVGLKQYCKEVYYLREFRGGTVVGKDQYGNTYYEMADEDLVGFPFCIVQCTLGY